MRHADIFFVEDKKLTEEAYGLEIGKDNITITAASDKGALYALQTLQQLFLLNKTSGQLPRVKIQDSPSFSWRGAELDVARHFFSKEYLFKFIDLLASYKFNKLHLHLSDDQGWRLEIKKYPKLTQKGAWRTFNNHDKEVLEKAKKNPDFDLPKEYLKQEEGKTLYGGFYTQQDMKEIIAYAQSRNIEIIPEIDMPGHMMVATENYPELLLDGKSSGWGKQFSVPINPCQESTYTFVENVLGEVAEIFPSSFLHIGADEVEKHTWKESVSCQRFMQEHQLKNLNELQSYFVGRVNQYLKKKGKTAIGWDEILEGPSDPSMVVMYWRGWEKNAPLTAVERNHKIIMTPNNPLYFDYLPNSSSVESVYHMKVVPSDIPQDKKGYFLGAQANIWTEIIPSPQRLEFMILPRITALAENVWTNQDMYSAYSKRLIQHYKLWDEKKYNYRLPDLLGFTDEQVIVDGKSVLHPINPLKDGLIRYTTDGSVPESNSPILKNQLVVTQASKVRFAAFSPSGAKSELYEVNFKPGKWHKAEDISTTIPGLKVEFYKGVFKNTKAIAGEVVSKEILPNVAISDTFKMPSFGAKFSGWLKVPEKGIYNFYFTCDDGGVLKIAQQIVVDNDGQHSPIMKSGQIALDKGLHPLQVDFLEAGGGFTLKLQYSVNGSAPQAVPDDWFSHQP